MKLLVFSLMLFLNVSAYSQTAAVPISENTRQLEERKRQLQEDLRRMANEYTAQLNTSKAEIERLEKGQTGSIAAIEKQNQETEAGITQLTEKLKSTGVVEFDKNNQPQVNHAKAFDKDINPTDLKSDLQVLNAAKTQLAAQNQQVEVIRRQIATEQQKVAASRQVYYDKRAAPLKNLQDINTQLPTSRQADFESHQQILRDTDFKSVQNQVITLGALGELNNIKTNILDDKQKLAAIEAAVDRTITGAYLKQKMANLLTDQNGPLCKAAKACGGKPKDAVTDKDLEKLFPSVKRAEGSASKTSASQGATQ
jgi:hypothetical protein